MSTPIYSIYLITNLVDNKKYVGFSRYPKKRWRRHMYGNERQHGRYFHNAISKYGPEQFVFQIIYQSTDWNHCLNVMEPYFIRFYNTIRPHGYNLTSGGVGCPEHIISEETRLKMRNSHLGKHHSESTKRKIRKSNKGLKRTEDSRKKMSMSQKGRKHPEEVKEKIRQSLLARNLSA